MSRREALRSERVTDGSGSAPDPRILPSRVGGEGIPGRRTVTIRGQGAERYAPRQGAARRTGGSERQLRAYERSGFRPDRVAMWAVLLGVMLVVVAATSAHAADHASVAHAIAALALR